ncbi:MULTISPECIES: thiopeptide-type bacteriocin biosynthesis protein [Clavibacter]|uniref:SagB/ThcOx family dehydrogenase n=2 Tax=Clavibacter TaxID=1573 RepID=A0A399NZ65_9MICO|nr:MULTISPECIES: thiopeptide-type bacteriocin biosynthesis protein [Clavibacter]KDP89817.1 hypothetical protein W824_15090 [Clavibacter cf. michiganensis LMG 26808]RII99091.1 SagB/ThcOx family dehydrogenase [Clavibacter michiganensis]UKF26710.1 thiopeptide-type bacteriocin biosynthesis protein [Clavibacter sp. A6099]
MTASPRWQTLEIYLHRTREEVDRVLVDVVQPLLDELRDAGAIDEWYFLRYWHDGPHLRVRVLNALLVEGIRATLSSRITPGDTASPAFSPADFYAGFAPSPGERRWSADGEIRIAGYEPEVERYGGAAAIRDAERLFIESGRVALSVIAATEDRGKRFAVAADLLFLTVTAVGWTTLETVRQARGYFSSWDYSDETLPVPSEPLRQAAERAFTASPDRWIGRSRVLGPYATADGEDTYSQWSGAVRRYSRALHELSGESMTNSHSRIIWSQVHMLHNRLGLTIDEERILAWLVSMAALASAGGTTSHDEALGRPDRRYLEWSKYTRNDAPASLEALPPVKREEGPSPDRAAPFPPPRPLLATMQRALDNRRSVRDGFVSGLTAQDVGDLLLGAAGQKPEATRPSRPYPSPGGAFATELYFHVTGVVGLDDGLHHFDPVSRGHRPVAGNLPLDALNGMSPYLGESQDGGELDLSGAQVVLFLVTRLEALEPKYGPRSLRLALLEAGHLSQALCLVASALALGSLVVSGYADDALNAALHLDGVDSFVSEMLVIGKRDPLRGEHSIRPD